MEEMEAMMEAQGERIIALEEEVAVLRTRKACKCQERNVTASGSGSQEDPIELEEGGLEYAEEEGLGSNQSYHTPPRAEEALLIFGSPVSQTLPAEVSETCSCLFVWRNLRDTMWVLNVLLMGILRLISVHLLVIAIDTPNNLALVLIHIRGFSWVKTVDSPASRNCAPPYSKSNVESITAALDVLQGRLELRSMFQAMPTEDLRRDLRQLVLIQRTIVHVLQLVEGIASDVLCIFVDREAEWEQEQEDLGQGEIDEVVDAGHGVDDGENFDYDGNLDS